MKREKMENGKRKQSWNLTTTKKLFTLLFFEFRKNYILLKNIVWASNFFLGMQGIWNEVMKH